MLLVASLRADACGQPGGAKKCSVLELFTALEGLAMSVQSWRWGRIHADQTGSVCQTPTSNMLYMLNCLELASNNCRRNDLLTPWLFTGGQHSIHLHA